MATPRGCAKWIPREGDCGKPVKACGYCAEHLRQALKAASKIGDPHHELRDR